MRQCTKCKKELPATEEYFYADKRASDGLRSRCKRCLIEDTGQYNKQNREKYIEYSRQYDRQNQEKIRKRRLKRRYGITPEQRLRLFVKQRGKCAICGEEKKLSEFCIDHNHDTGEVRGLLCRCCNGGIGLLKDNPEILEKAKEYLDYERTNG